MDRIRTDHYWTLLYALVVTTAYFLGRWGVDALVFIALFTVLAFPLARLAIHSITNVAVNAILRSEWKGDNLVIRVQRLWGHDEREQS
jgi:hypothetical protein